MSSMPPEKRPFSPIPMSCPRALTLRNMLQSSNLTLQSVWNHSISTSAHPAYGFKPTRQVSPRRAVVHDSPQPSYPSLLPLPAFWASKPAAYEDRQTERTRSWGAIHRGSEKILAHNVRTGDIRHHRIPCGKHLQVGKVLRTETRRGHRAAHARKQLLQLQILPKPGDTGKDPQGTPPQPPHGEIPRDVRHAAEDQVPHQHHAVPCAIRH